MLRLDNHRGSRLVRWQQRSAGTSQPHAAGAAIYTQTGHKEESGARPSWRGGKEQNLGIGVYISKEIQVKLLALPEELHAQQDNAVQCLSPG